MPPALHTDLGIFITESEYQERLERLRQKMAARELNAVCLFGTWWIYYFTGFAYQPSERPVCVVIPREGAPAVFAPQLEQEHLESHPILNRHVMLYPEYPGVHPPMEYLLDLINSLGLSAARIGVDSTGYGGMWGSRTPSLPELLPQAGIVSFRKDGIDSRLVVKRLREQGIAAAPRQGWVRVSPHFYVSPEEIERTIAALP